VVTAIGHTDDRLIADQVTDVATITPTAAGEYIVNSREEFLAGEITPLAQQLDAAYETFQQEHEHEQELAEAVDEAAAPEGLSPVYYKAAIAVLSVAVVGHHRAVAGGDLSVANDSDIRHRMDRVEEIIEQFDPDEISLDEGSEIYEEGQELLAEIRNLLHEDEGEIIKIE